MRAIRQHIKIHGGAGSTQNSKPAVVLSNVSRFLANVSPNIVSYASKKLSLLIAQGSNILSIMDTPYID